jgi:hypothetical protein
MMRSATSGYYPGFGMRFEWSSRLKMMVSSDQSRKDDTTLSAAWTLCHSRLRWLVDMSINGPLKMREDVLHNRQTVNTPVAGILFGLVILRGDMTIVLF